MVRLCELARPVVAPSVPGLVVQLVTIHRALNHQEGQLLLELLPPVRDHRAQGTAVVLPTHVRRGPTDVSCAVHPDRGTELQAFEWEDHVCKESGLHVGRERHRRLPLLRALGQRIRARPHGDVCCAPGAAHKANRHTAHGFYREQGLTCEPRYGREPADVGARWPCPTEGVAVAISELASVAAQQVATVDRSLRPKGRRAWQALSHIGQLGCFIAVVVRQPTTSRHYHEPERAGAADLVREALLLLHVFGAKLMYVGHRQVDIRLA
mmetsp:Transcript_28941/g.92280  ORF Transcript_28941/g.92280 Transcript_28941/m.92280 type:complete len:267 (+) Transcript_28941:1181-1981(+)